MLPKQKRLSTELFQAVMQHGITYHSSHFSLRRSLQATHSVSRFSVVVSKKVQSKAVQRNWLKRRIYTIISHKAPSDLPTAAYIFFAKKQVYSVTVEQLQEEIVFLLRKAHTPNTIII